MATKDRPDAGETLPAASASPAPELPPQTITIPVVLPLNQHARMWMLLSGVLGIMLVAALVIVGYLWNVNGKWQAQVTSLTSTGYDLGDRIAEHQKRIDQLDAATELLTDQLATAKDKVLALSNEKAQWSDQTAYAQQQVDLLDSQVEGAQAVITQLGRCIEGEKQLQLYIDASTAPPVPSPSPDSVVYTPAQIAEYRTSVEKLCTAATNATAKFQKSITE